MFGDLRGGVSECLSIILQSRGIAKISEDYVLYRDDVGTQVCSNVGYIHAFIEHIDYSQRHNAKSTSTLRAGGISAKACEKLIEQQRRKCVVRSIMGCSTPFKFPACCLLLIYSIPAVCPSEGDQRYGWT